MQYARLDSNQRPLPSQGSTLPLSYGRVESLRQESNPHLGRTKGACLPLTLRRLDGDGRSRTRSSSLQARRSSDRATSPRCGRVESNHHSRGQRLYRPLSSPVLSVRANRAVGRTRTDTARVTTSGACRYTTTTTERGRPESNRRPLGGQPSALAVELHPQSGAGGIRTHGLELMRLARTAAPLPRDERSAWLESNQRSPAPEAGGVAVSPTGSRTESTPGGTRTRASGLRARRHPARPRGREVGGPGLEPGPARYQQAVPPRTPTSEAPATGIEPAPHE
jgi:hypothetical protein